MADRRSLLALALAPAFCAGLLASRFLEGEARAQRSTTGSVVFVPSDGIAFRTLDGRPIARLAYDAHGGFLELYDEHARAVASWHGAGVASTRVASAGPAASASPAPAADLLQGSPLDLGY